MPWLVDPRFLTEPAAFWAIAPTVTREGFVPYGPSRAGAAGPAGTGRDGPPITWLASPAADGVTGERIVATEFDDWLRGRSRT